MADPKSPATDSGGAERKAKILELAERMNVKFMRLQFTDILGVIKNVEIPDRQFAAALDGEIMFDGSSIEGFVRIEESDMYLRPDLSTFRILPWTQHTGERIGRLICDIHNPDGTPFAGCPRHALKRAIAGAADAGFTMNCGPGGRVLPVPDARRPGRPPRRTTRPATSTSRRSTSARTCGGRSCWRSSRWASRSRRRTTRWPPASTRSTSATTTC